MFYSLTKRFLILLFFVVFLSHAGATQGGRETVYFYFYDAEVSEVIQAIFGDFLKANYIIEPGVKGKISLSMAVPVEKKEVLSFTEALLRLNKISFVEERGLYRIIPLKDAPKEVVLSQLLKPYKDAAIETFTFKNLNIRSLPVDVKNFKGLNVLGKTFGIIPFNENSILIIASKKDDLDLIKRWLADIDDLYYRTRPEVFVYRPKNRRANDIMPKLTDIVKDSPLSGSGTQFLADEKSNSLIIIATPSDYAIIKEILESIDRPRRQVLIEAIVAEVELSEDMGYGTRWIIENDLKLTINPLKDINLSGPLELKATINSPSLTFTAIDSEGKIKLLLQSLYSMGRARIISRPSILISDGMEARLQVGSLIPMATQSLFTTEGSALSSTVQYSDAGIILKVKPEIKGEFLSIIISEEVSSIGGLVSVGGQGFNTIKKTEADTTVLVRDGDAILIGGLIRSDETASSEGLYPLKDLFLSGSFLKGERMIETVLLIRPGILRD